MEPLQPHADPLDTARLIVSIPIHSSPGDSVVMFAEDYERWTREHGIRNPHIKLIGRNRYVTFRPHNDTATVILARFILDSPKGRQVFLVDGNPLNLRRTNIGCKKGGAGGMKHGERKPVSPPAKPVTVAWPPRREPPAPLSLPRMPLAKAVVAEKVRTRGTA